MPNKKLPFDLADLETPTDRLLRETALSRLGTMGLTPAVQETIDGISASRLGNIGLSPAMQKAIEGISKSCVGMDSRLFEHAIEARDAFTKLAEPHGGMAEMWRKMAVQDHLGRDLIEASNAFQKLSDARTAQWASILARTKLPDLAALYSNASAVFSEATKLRELAQMTLGQDVIKQISRLNLGFELPDGVTGFLGDTSLKMSVLAGVEYTSGIDTRAFQEAYTGLLGSWHTTPQLPETFWLDPATRQQSYRDADVDPGIIVAPPSATVQIMVESGLAAGDVDENGTVALFGFGRLSVAIRSSAAELDAHSAVVAFERSLREFISERLESHIGPNWFKQRVQGQIHANAKGKRSAALGAGERSTRLIDYTDFGELKEIILRADNWEQVFEPIFVNRIKFEQDMQTLIAVRRPSSHSRLVDSTQLLEALLVMRRLDSQMADGGAWLTIANSDD